MNPEVLRWRDGQKPEHTPDEHRRATKNGDNKNNIAEHHPQTDHRIDWDSTVCISFSTEYYQRLTPESWFTNLERTPLNR